MLSVTFQFPTKLMMLLMMNLSKTPYKSLIMNVMASSLILTHPVTLLAEFVK